MSELRKFEAMSIFHIPIAASIAWCCVSLSALSAEESTQPPAPKSDTAPAEEAEVLEKKSPPPAADSAKPSATDSKKSAPEDVESTDQPQPPPPKKKTNLTEDILEGLGLTGEQAAGNPLDTIVERMRNVQQRLQKTETDQETRQLQTQIVKDLDDLIEKLKNQKPPPPPKSDQNQPPPPPMGNPPPDSAPRGGQPKPQNSQKQRGGADRQPQAQKSKPDQQPAGEKKTSGDKSRDSDQQLNRGRSAEEEAARQRLAKDVWGHLPAAMRQELLNVYSEKFLPKYDDLVRKYYEALAEQNRRNP